MMEGMNQAGQEEYIWAMRTSLYRESDSDLWKERRIHGKKSKSYIDTSIDDYQTKVMASLVPDEVIYNVDDYNHRQYDACFLFGDVSGFTELCEKYTKTGVSGPSRMTQVLNKYLGSMVQEVMSHDGDVLKFSGDAFLAMFKANENETMRDAVHEALDCALVIQKNYGSYLTDVGVMIRVKLAISCGLVTFALIGDETTSHYVVVGKPIWDVKAGESISSAGDIIVAPAAYHYINTNEYLFQDMPDNVHIKILGVGPNWRSMQKNIRQHKQEKAEDAASVETQSVNSDDEDDLGLESPDDFLLRPSVQHAVRNKIKEHLRRFIIAPVMKSIEMNEPFEYLTEMRQVVVVFINVVSDKLETKETVILADRTYKIVCSVVDKLKGCVNKVSLFDKDLMFVVIFGLRGLKHELECQVALRCARECHEAISKLPGVLSASIGVTTGKTYCGVFGHTLRREYTVISLVVNKAARLMVAYKGKVTCDRETFLHSKLEARHFILQEPRHLKGISHAGPVYEYRESVIDHNRDQKVSARPLLGKQDKIKLYQQLLEKCLTTDNTNEQQYKMLLIKGEARQGKTRVLDEIVYITPESVPVSKITLSLQDRKIPFNTIRLAFYIPLDLIPESSVKEKEMKLLNVLRKIQVPELLCALNNVFGVNFKNSPTFLNLSEKAKLTSVKNMLKQLSYVCFTKLWVLAIDNCEYMDDESWEVFDSLFEIKTIFIVGTMGRDKLNYCSPNAKKILEDVRVRVVDLLPIEKWYLGALACQILDVYAISPELENAIQIRSNGSPGWVESFLISVFQDDGLYILRATLRDINDLGLVCPPLYMMARLTSYEHERWQLIMEEKGKSEDGQTPAEDDWQRYIDCCRDSYLNVTVREQMENMSRGGKVPVCIISPNFRLGDEEMEHTIGAMILKTFDSLNFFEQLLVKCSAILGNQFLRDMLLYVMSATGKRKAALAVQKLFEIRVLTCAKGDFIESGMRVFKEKLMNPDDETEPICRCKGLKIDESCLDLPKYASCGYLQFKSSLFREITYNLLTDNQKKEFHQRAIRYLERETRKCKACGNGFFESILGSPRPDRDFVAAKDRRKELSASHSSFDLDSHRGSIHSASYSTNSKRKFDEKSIVSFPAQGTDMKVDDAYETFGCTMIKRLKNSYSLTKAFSSEDFTDCQCLLILSTTYAQLIDHCAGANDLKKVVDAMIEYARVSILLCNIPLAVKILHEAVEVVNERAKEKTTNVWQLSLIRGKIYTLLGYARLEMGQISNALEGLQTSLSEYGKTFPQGCSKKFRTCLYETKQLFSYYVFPRRGVKQLDVWETMYTNNLAECLAHLCTVFMLKEEWKDAELAASWSLVKAIESFNNFQIICTAFANMLRVAQHFRKWSMCIAIEIHSLQICHLKRGTIEAEDLKCVAHLYSVIFCSRLLRADMDKAIHIGYIDLRLCFSIRAVHTVLKVIPFLLYALLIGKHFNNVYSVLQELEYFAGEDTDSSGRVWYLAFCVEIQLETGYTVLPYHMCEMYYQMEGETWITIRDPEARRRFFTVMWLWCVRNEKWEDASVWCLKTSDFAIIKDNDSLASKITALYLLEGMIIYLVSKLDKRNIKGVIRAENEINCLIDSLTKAAETIKIIQPRLNHLKAYFKFVQSNDAKISTLLDKAQKYAHDCANLLELSWIEHSQKAWNRNLPAIQIDFWREHMEIDSLLKFEDLEVSGGKLGHFTLHLPIYI